MTLETCAHMAFREFFVAALLVVITRTQGRTYIDQASNRRPHVTQQNDYTIDGKTFALTQNNYDGNGPKTQVNYRSAVQNNFGSYNHYPNLGGNFVGKRRQDGRKYNGIQGNNGQDEKHWDSHGGHGNIAEDNAFDGFLQYNSNSHVVNNFGGFNGPNIPDKSTREQVAKPRGSGGEFTFLQNNVNSHVTHVYPKKTFITSERDRNFRDTIDNGDNAYAGTNTALPRGTIVRINESIRNKLADVQRHLDNSMDNLRIQLGKIPHYFNDIWSITPTYNFNPGRSPTGSGSGGTHYKDNDDNILRNGISNGGANGNRQERPVHPVERRGHGKDGGSGIPDGHSMPAGGTHNYPKNYPRKNCGGSAANDPRRSDAGYRPPTQYNGNGIPTPGDSTRRQQGERPQIEMDVNNVDGYSSNSKK